MSCVGPVGERLVSMASGDQLCLDRCELHWRLLYSEQSLRSDLQAAETWLGAGYTANILKK